MTSPGGWMTDQRGLKHTVLGGVHKPACMNAYMNLNESMNECEDVSIDNRSNRSLNQ